MASKTRLILPFAATTAIAVMLSTAAPVAAAELKVTASEASPVVKTVPYRIRHHAWLRHHGRQGTRIAASSRYNGPDRRVSPIASHLECSGVWCGRQYVLMVGIGF